mgnify:CR=1 FL=1
MSEQMKTPRKWTKVLLIVSLALNACFIGLIIGVKLTQDGMRPFLLNRSSDLGLALFACTLA